MHGMWYTNDGELNPYIDNLTEGISAHLPMDHHERYGQDNKRWYSGCQDLEQLKHWFSHRDILELNEAGYKLYEFHATQYQNEQYQTIFTRESIITQTEINLQTLLDN